MTRVLALPLIALLVSLSHLWARQTGTGPLHFIALKSDGTSVRGLADPNDGFVVRTSTGDQSVRLRDLTWMVHAQDEARIRTGDSNDLITGPLRESSFRITTSARTESIALPALAFIARSDLDPAVPVQGRVGVLFVLESIDGVGIISEIVSASNDTSMQVFVVPQRWVGEIDISHPAYPRAVPSDRDLTMSIDVRGAGTYRNVRGSADELAVSCFFMAMRGRTPFAGNSGWASLRPLADSLPSEEMQPKPVEIRFFQPFQIDTQAARTTFTGEGHAFVAIVRLDRAHLGDRAGTFDRFANGRLEVLRTASNVLKLPITVTKP